MGIGKAGTRVEVCLDDQTRIVQDVRLSRFNSILDRLDCEKLQKCQCTWPKFLALDIGLKRQTQWHNL